MRLLLDTHCLIWALVKPQELSSAAAAEIENPRNTVYFSPVSIWEIAAKYRLGRRSAPPMSGREAMNLAFEAGCKELPPTSLQAAMLDTLPLHHHDPFDRMLIAQAVSDGLTLVSRDAEISAYVVPLIKA